MAGVAALALAACAGTDDGIGSGGAGACRGLLAGDLVLSEIMANPEGPDTGAEYIEIYNAGGAEIDLSGVVLIRSNEDGSRPKQHALAGGSIAAGGYAVLGNVLPEAAPAHVDRGYGDGLGDMTNESGRLALVCGDTLVDEAIYSEVREGAARILDGSQPPDALLNDTLDNWCDAPNAFAGRQFGSPGAANARCGDPLGTTPSFCTAAGGATRPVNAAAPGEVIFSEVMANPEAAPDDDGEWIELYVSADVDLNGLALGFGAEEVEMQLGGGDCLPVAAGDYVLLARSDDGAGNGGLPAVDHRLGFGLTNAGKGLWMGVGGELVDAATYAETAAGRSYQLDPGKLEAAANDLAENWCSGTEAFGDGDRGTPGAVNGACPVVVPDGQCLDGGTPRAIVAPSAGDLVITEFLANPAATSDTRGEWFEIRAMADVDLNGLEVGKAPGDVDAIVAAAACLEVAAGDHVVFGREMDTAKNGGIPTMLAALAISLTNSDSGLAIGHGGTTLDAVTYAATLEGIATSLNPADTSRVGNDDLRNWCAATAAYGDGDKGTPGRANPVCTGEGIGDGDGGGDGDGALPATACVDGAGVRAIVPPIYGDLVFTELMANPAAVDDGDGEWFELTARAAVDLNGLELGKNDEVEDVVDQDACLRAGPGQVILFATHASAATNGGLPAVDVVYGGLSLSNNAPATYYVAASGVTVDAIHFASASTAGRSLSLDPAYLDPDRNDGFTGWCTAKEQAGYGLGDYGTPGTTNPGCGQCWDPGTLAFRDPALPATGEVSVTELMADSGAVGDDDGEWIELLAGTEMDLNGLRVTTSTGAAATIDDAAGRCIALANGAYGILAPITDPAANGGLPRVDGVLGFAGPGGPHDGDLAEPDGTVALELPGGGLLDLAPYRGAVQGYARQISLGQEGVVANDDQANWCDALSATYGGAQGGDYGSPGATNAVCAGTETPGPGALVISEIMQTPDSDASNEYIELHNPSPTTTYQLLGCTIADGNSNDTVTMPVAIAPGGFVHFGRSVAAGGNHGPPDFVWSGIAMSAGEEVSLACGGDVIDRVDPQADADFPDPDGASYTLDPDRYDAGTNDRGRFWCAGETDLGNGDFGTPGAGNDRCPPPPGYCDSGGGVTRPIHAPAPGELILTEVMANPDLPGDGDGEWFEVYVTGTVASIDLNGLGLAEEWTGVTEETITPAGAVCLAVDGGEYLVFADEASSAVNGGITDVTYAWDAAVLSMTNSGDGLSLSIAGGVLLDSVSWTSSATNGASRMLRFPGNATTTNDNVDGAAWCDGRTAFGDGDLGTPGAANDCP